MKERLQRRFSISNRNRTLLIIVLFIVVLLLSGCGLLQANATKMVSDPMSEALMLKALDSLNNNDKESFRALFEKGVLPEGEEFSSMFTQIHKYYRGVIVSWEAKSKDTYTNNNAEPHKIVTCVYAVNTNIDAYLISITRVESGEQNLIRALNIVLSNDYKAAVTPTGYLSDIGHFSAFQWILLITNILVYGFIVFTIIKCLRDNIRRKVLFVIISIVQIAFTASIGPGSFHVGFSVTVAAFASQMVYPDGGTITTVVLPLGAFIYWGLRKKLIYDNIRSSWSRSIATNNGTEDNRK